MKSLLTLTLISGLMGVQSAMASEDCMNQAHSIAYEKYLAQSPQSTMISTSLKFKPVEKENVVTYYIKISDPEASATSIMEVNLDKQTCTLVK